MSESKVQQSFSNMKKCVFMFGVVCVIVLGTVAAVTFTGSPASSFMWVRGAILLIVAPILYRMVTRAEQGDAKVLDRVKTIGTILPIAIIVVDLIPGLCPVWYAALQGLGALALLPVAFLTRSAPVKSTFPAKA